MFTSSVPILLSTCSFPSISSADASPTSASLRLKAFRIHPKPVPRFPTPSNLAFLPWSHRSSKIVALSSTNNPSIVEDCSVEPLLRNPSANDFERFKKGAEIGSWHYQTAIVGYRKRFPPSFPQPHLEVDLFSTVHIADKEYFATLRKALESYDCVLYEMVVRRKILENGKNSPIGRRLKDLSSNWSFAVNLVHQLLGGILGLVPQTHSCLDYHAENWYHADLDYETFKQLELERSKTTKATFPRLQIEEIELEKAMEQALAIALSEGFKLQWASCWVSEYPVLEALLKLDCRAALKLTLAKGLSKSMTEKEIEEEMGDYISVIIDERNKAAMEVLRRAIEAGQKRIAILYGAGHMPDFEIRLREELDLVPYRTEWVTAWLMKSRDYSNSLPLLKTMAEVLRWPFNVYQNLALLVYSLGIALFLMAGKPFLGVWLTGFSKLNQFFMDVFMLR